MNRLTRLNADQLNKLIQVVRAQDSESRFHAMVGLRVCTNTKINCFDAGDSQNQLGLVAKAKKFWDVGFDGVQLDLEPIPSGSNDLISILKRIRAVKPQGKMLSIAGYMLERDAGAPNVNPQPRSRSPLLQWSRSYYERLLELVDLVMVMNYDTALRDPKEYRMFTAWQTREIMMLVGGRNIRVQIGLPSNVAGRTGLFDRNAENVTVGSLGIADALREAGADCPSGFGVAVFTESGMTADLFSHFVQSWASSSREAVK